MKPQAIYYGNKFCLWCRWEYVGRHANSRTMMSEIIAFPALRRRCETNGKLRSAEERKKKRFCFYWIFAISHSRFFRARCCSHRCFGVSEVEMNSIVGWFLVWNWKLHRNDSLCYSTSTKTLTHKHTTTGAARRSALKWAKKWVLFENGGKEENFIVLARKWKRVHEIRLDGLEF